MNDFDSVTADLLPETRHALRHRVAVGQADGRAPSLVAGLVRNGSLVWTGGRGSVDGSPPDENTQYRIGSITKTFVAVLVMRLRDEGRITLLDRLDTHLPELAGRPGGAARIGELLAHTAGITSETPPPWWERTDGAVRPQPGDLLADDAELFAAGRHFHYSNPGFALLGVLVGALRERSWLESVRVEILEPLGMTRTSPMPLPATPGSAAAPGFAVHPWADVLQPEPAHDAGLSGPAGQLWSTVNDLARFAAVLTGDEPSVLASETAAEMRTPASPPSSASSGPEWRAGYGLGLVLGDVNGRDLAGHTGSMPGFVASLWTSDADGLAAICFANSTAGPMVPAIAADLIDIVATREPALPPEWTPAEHVDRELLALTGPWYWGPTPLSVSLRPDGRLDLRALAGRGRTSRFTPHGDGTWRGLDGYYLGETLSVVRAADGAVSHLDIGSFVFTREPYDATRADDPIPGGVDPSGWRGTAD